MDLSLTPELERLVHDKVASGMYPSSNDVIREALYLLNERDKVRSARLQELRSEIDKGFQSGEPIEVDFDDVIQRGRERYNSRKKN